MVNRRSVIRIDDNTFLREPTQFRIVIIAAVAGLLWDAASIDPETADLSLLTERG